MQADWLRRFAKLVVHPVPLSWDYIFSRGKSYWVIFHLKNGQRIGGYYSSGSFASTYPDTQEIYVEELWRLDENGTFKEMVKSSAGGYFRTEDCHFIEFLSLEENHKNGGQ